MFLVDLSIVSPEIVAAVTRIDDDVVEVIGLCSERSANETQQSKENSFQERTAKRHGTGWQALISKPYYDDLLPDFVRARNAFLGRQLEMGALAIC
jgi:hypothetical protein